MSEIKNKSIVTVDNQFAVIVDSEKTVLVREVIKHFAGRWQGEAQDAIKSGKEPEVSKAVASMLKRLSVDFEIACGMESVDVLNGTHAAPQKATEELTPEEPEAPKADKSAQSFTNPMMQR